MATEPLVRWDLAGTTGDEGTAAKETRAFPASTALRIDRVAVKDGSHGLQSMVQARQGVLSRSDRGILPYGPTCPTTPTPANSRPAAAGSASRRRGSLPR